MVCYWSYREWKARALNGIFQTKVLPSVRTVTKQIHINLTLQRTTKNLLSRAGFEYIFRFLVFHISEDGSEIELKHCASSKTSVKTSQKHFVHQSQLTR